jgi:hypothetical protein
MGDDPQWFPYARGFKMAGDVSVTYVEEASRDQDFLGFPILANYRQYIELSLKSIIRDARSLLDKDGDAPKTHDLLSLWREARTLLTDVSPDGDERDLDNVEACLERLHEIDPTSQGSRRPARNRTELDHRGRSN